MLSYQHILVAMDLSEVSEHVLQRAVQMRDDAKQAKLSMVHVMEFSPVAYGGEFSIPIDVNLEQQLESQARKELERLGEQYKIEYPDQYVETGSVKNAVVKLADKLKVDLIVVGTHGHSGLAVLLGSRANAILHHANCDVLVVRST